MESPAFISRPHFHLADPFYREQFQYGIQAKEGEHDSAFLVEPQSSIPLRVEMRLQLNILLRKVEGIEYLFKNLPEVMFPVFWFDSVAAIPEEMAGSLHLLVMLPMIMQVKFTYFVKSLLTFIAFNSDLRHLQHHQQSSYYEQHLILQNQAVT